MSEPLPLAAAATRLRKRPGRPRKAKTTDLSPTAAANAAGCTPISPRLLDIRACAVYLGNISEWTVRDLIASGALKRVVLPGTNGRDLRRVLVDREDCDRLIEATREQ